MNRRSFITKALAGIKRWRRRQYHIAEIDGRRYLIGHNPFMDSRFGKVSRRLVHYWAKDFIASVSSASS